MSNDVQLSALSAQQQAQQQSTLGGSVTTSSIFIDTGTTTNSGLILSAVGYLVGELENDENLLLLLEN
ncbi:MAG: hypothetical protein O7D95_03040 [Betaproteobacteria bacterium]|nr:hypothetical protein [Betaproteobacteria bacterium]